MPERFTPRNTGFNSNSRHQSPINNENDRYTPPADTYSYRQNPPSPPIKTAYTERRNEPEMFHVDTKRNNANSNYDEKPSSPLIHNAYSPALSNRPELYHLNTDENPDHPTARSPPIQSAYTLSQTKGPEFYHLSPNENSNMPSDIPPYSPTPIQTFPTDKKIELFSIKANAEPFQPSSSPPMHNTPKFDDNTIIDQVPDKITMYTLTAENRENQPPPSPIRKQTTPPIYTVPIKTQSTVKQNPFPTSLRDVQSNVRYVPLSQSKASESIQRSMMKYRFNGY